MPLIKFEGNVPVPYEDLMRHVQLSKKRGHPYVSIVPPHDRKLAVVGGGPSVLDHVEELRGYKDIWAINGACGWLRDRGIESTLLTLDPCDFLAPRVSGAKKAILSSRCHPKVFEVLKDCDITLFDVVQDAVLEGGYGIWASVSTASSVFQLATDYGFRDTTFYGCEGSYQQSTHIYMDDPECSNFQFVVSCGGSEYLTAPDMYEQVKAMIPVMKTFSNHFKEKCGGLLRAMLANEEHDIVKVSRGLLAGLKPIEKPRCARCGSQWHTDCYEKGEAA